MTTILRNRAVVMKGNKVEETHKTKRMFWGLIKHDEIVHTKDLGYDLVIRVDSKPVNIFLQVGDMPPHKIGGVL